MLKPYRGLRGCKWIEIANRKQKTRHACTCRVFGSGDVLLSHGLSPYYHRGCSVSLPCSEWERVVPLRYSHQTPEPEWRFAAIAASSNRCRSLETMSIFQRTADS